MHFVSANLQARKEWVARAARLHKEAKASLGECIFLLQEIRKEGRGKAKGKGKRTDCEQSVPRGTIVYRDAKCDTGIMLPASWGRQVVRSCRSMCRACSVQVGDIALGSVHLPTVGGQAAEDEAGSILEGLSALWEGWRAGERPPKCFVVGIDANVELPSNLAGRTGPHTGRRRREAGGGAEGGARRRRECKRQEQQEDQEAGRRRREWRTRGR